MSFGLTQGLLTLVKLLSGIDSWPLVRWCKVLWDIEEVCMDRQNRMIDLSHVIDENLAHHPYDEPLDMVHHKSLAVDGFNDTKISTGMHIGTHMDAPSHMTNRKIFISDIPLERLVGRGILFDVRGQEEILLDDEALALIREGDVVLFFTGFGEKFGGEGYFDDYPVISETLADLLVVKKVKMVGTDTPSPDKFPYNIHKKLLSHDILIIENLVNLESLIDVKDFTIHAVPMKIAAEGAPVRVWGLTLD